MNRKLQAGHIDFLPDKKLSNFQDPDPKNVYHDMPDIGINMTPSPAHPSCSIFLSFALNFWAQNIAMVGFSFLETLSFLKVGLEDRKGPYYR